MAQISETNHRPAFTLSVLIAVLAVIASAGGLSLNGLYRDNTFVTSAWKGNDVITLFLAVPLLVMAMIFSKRGSLKAQLVWMGMLDYLLYNYAFYLFGATFNWFFLLYIALLVLSIFALILGLLGLDTYKISQHAQKRMPVKWIAGYLLFVAVGLTLIYVAQSVGFIFTGQLPAIVAKRNGPWPVRNPNTQPSSS